MDEVREPTVLRELSADLYRGERAHAQQVRRSSAHGRVHVDMLDGRTCHPREGCRQKPNERVKVHAFSAAHE